MVSVHEVAMWWPMVDTSSEGSHRKYEDHVEELLNPVDMSSFQVAMPETLESISLAKVIIVVGDIHSALKWCKRKLFTLTL